MKKVKRWIGMVEKKKRLEHYEKSKKVDRYG